jgi:hypothetical protein
MSENIQSKPAKTTHRIRGFILYVARLLLAFLLGFVPTWLKSRERSSSLSEAERQSSLAKMLGLIVIAVNLLSGRRATA